MPPLWETIEGPAGSLAVHLARRPTARPTQAGALVICHGFPVGPDATDRVVTTLPTLAERLVSETDSLVLVGCLRGVGGSQGDFSLAGWRDDLEALVEHGAGLASGRVWVIGFGTGGALGVCVAAGDERVRGAACFGSPATFDDWAQDVEGMLAYARRVGVIRSDGFPADHAAWARAFTSLRPAEAAALLPPRPLLVVHGADDEEVPVADGRLLADAAAPTSELRVLPGAGHGLRADPRAVALLAGWLERQGP